MRLYSLHDVIFSGKERYLIVKDGEERDVAYLRKENSQEDVFSYTSLDGNTNVTVGIKKSGKGRLVKATYHINAYGNDYLLHGNLPTNLIYFCLKGTIENHKIVVEENWAGDVDLKVNKQKVAFIRDYWGDSKVSFGFDEDVKENSLLFALNVLIYFMLKIYEKENQFIDEVFNKIPQ